MWGDAKELGDHEVAEADPFRWSDWLNVVGTIADLEAYNTPANQNRAVELVKGSSKTDNMLLPMRFGSISEAISYLSAMTTTQPPVVVEKTQKVVIPGLGTGDCAAQLDNMEALGYMAAGSALTVALYVSLCALRRCCWGSMAKAHDEEDCQRQTPGCGGQHLAVVVLCGIRIWVCSRLSTLGPSSESWHRACERHPGGYDSTLQSTKLRLRRESWGWQE